MRLSLTDLTIQRLHFDTQTRVHDTQLKGFGVLVSKTTKTFFVVTGKNRKLTTLGRYPETSLKTARSEAKKLQTTPAPPSTQKTLQEAITAFERYSKDRVKPDTLKQYLYYLKELDSLDPTYDDIIKKLEKWPGPYSKAYAFASWRNFYNFCFEQDIIRKSPLYRKRVPVKTRSRDRVLTDEELGRIWRCTEDNTYGRILRLLILTGQRREEVRSLKPEDITDVITFHTKGDRTNVLPITPMVKEQLVLPFTFNNWSGAKARFDTECGVNFRHHDLRRTLATRLASLGTPVVVIERILGHSYGGKVYQTYQRHTFLDETRQALLTWEGHIARLVTA